MEENITEILSNHHSIEQNEEKFDSEDELGAPKFIPNFEINPKSEFLDFSELKINERTDKNRIKFSFLTRFFQKFSELKGRKKSEFLYIFLNEYILKHDRQNAYSIIRLMMPEHDRERNTYGLREVNLGKLFAESFSLPISESNRLKFYKNPNYQPVGSPTGDFPTVLYTVVRNLCRPDSIVTIGEINEFLDELAKAEENNEKVKIMIKMIQRCNGEDLKWLSKIILKDLRIGLHHEKVLTSFHPEALDLYNMTSNLKEVCKEFIDVNHTLSNVLRIFNPVKPMLAGKRQIDEIKQILYGKTIYIEVKYDGERIQCHFNNDTLKFFSRNSNDYTHIYGPKLSDIVRKHIKAQCAILDGEIIVINKHTSQIEPFGANKSVALNNSESDLQLCYKIFDILYVKGPQGEECNLMSLKLSDRKKVLKRIITNEKNVIELVEGYETSNLEDINSHFEQAIQRGEEGIILKQSESVYVARERSTTWLKMKADYIEGVSDTLDLLIIGAYYGEGYSRIGPSGDQVDHVTHFLCAIVKKIDKTDSSNSLFIPFCKIGTGYKVFELQSLRTKLKPFLIKYDARIKPRYLVNWTPAVSDRPDYIIDNPKNSIILEIKAAELIKSNSFPCDYTLRFPRVEKIRYDKDWFECMTYEELQKMLYDNEQALRKINKRSRKQSPHSHEGDEKDGIGKEIKKKVRTNKEINVLSQYLDTDISNIKVVSDLFKNCEFYIVNNNNNYVSKIFLEEQICRYGGNKVQNFLLTNTHIIASYLDFKLDAILKKHPCNILHPKWIIDSIRKGQLQDYAPKYLLYSLPWLEQRNNEMYDKYGDSFVFDIDKEGVKDLINEIKLQKDYIDDDIISIKNKYKERLIEKYFPLNGKSFFIIEYVEIFEKKMLCYKILKYGGKITNKLEGEIDFILEDDYKSNDLENIQKYRSLYRKSKIIDISSINDLIEKRV